MSDDIRVLSETLAADPSSVVFVQLGEALRRSGQAELAWRVATRGLERHAQRADAHDLVARIAVDRGDFARARDRMGNGAHARAGPRRREQGTRLPLLPAGRHRRGGALPRRGARRRSRRRVARRRARHRARVFVRRRRGRDDRLPIEEAPTRARARSSTRARCSPTCSATRPQTAILLDADGYVVAGQYLTGDGARSRRRHRRPALAA